MHWERRHSAVGEEEMVTKVLTKEMIEAGAALIRRLDTSSVQPNAAFWLYYPEDQKWKLVLSEGRLAADGPRRIYQEIQATLRTFEKEFEGLGLQDITLAEPDSSMVASLRLLAQTGAGLTGIRMTDNVVNGNVIEDAYIYRIQ